MERRRTRAMGLVFTELTAANASGLRVVTMVGRDPRESAAALGFANAMMDLPDKARPGGMLHVFGVTVGHGATKP